MKILMIDNSKGWGGAEQMLLSLAGGLRARGHQVGLFLREGSDCIDKFVYGGFDVWTFCGKGFGRLRGIIKMIHVARTGRFDLVHVHRNHDLMVGKIIGFFCGNLPLLLTQHCWLGKTSYFQLNLPDEIVTVSGYIANGISERFPGLGKKITVVHNGIKFSEFENANADYWRQLPQLAGKGPLLGVVGYFYKNQEELIELLPCIKAVFPNIVLIIIGRDEEKKPLLEEKAENLEVSDAVFFAGAIPHDEMKHALAGLDLNISAFRQEGFGLSVIEGMAVGTPFMGYRAGGYAEIIDQGKNGYLEDCGDRLSQTIIALLQDNDRFRRIRDCAKTSVMDKFSFETMLTSYEKIYKKMDDKRK